MANHQQPDLHQLLLQLDDPDPIVRQEATIALGDFCRTDHPAIAVLIERLQSPDHTFHDRACSAWALGRIKPKPSEVVPILFSIIETMHDDDDAGELRSCAVEAIERLTDNIEVLKTVVRHSVRDRYWKCRAQGLFLVERILKRTPAVHNGLVRLIKPLAKDESDEIRERAQQLLAGLEEAV